MDTLRSEEVPHVIIEETGENYIGITKSMFSSKLNTREDTRGTGELQGNHL